MIFEADGDVVWCVWADGTYCEEAELEQMTHMSDDFMRVKAVTYGACGTPLFNCGNSRSACEIWPGADFHLCSTTNAALASRTCFFSDADYSTYLLNAGADGALGQFNAHVAAKAKLIRSSNA